MFLCPGPEPDVTACGRVCVCVCMRVPHHTDLGLLAGAGGADESVQLDAQLLVLPQHLVEPLHEVLGLAGVRQVLWNTQRGR